MSRLHIPFMNLKMPTNIIYSLYLHDQNSLIPKNIFMYL